MGNGKGLGTGEVTQKNMKGLGTGKQLSMRGGICKGMRKNMGNVATLSGGAGNHPGCVYSMAKLRLPCCRLASRFLHWQRIARVTWPHIGGNGLCKSSAGCIPLCGATIIIIFIIFY